MDYFSVRAISYDDFHEHLTYLLSRFLSKDNSEPSTDKYMPNLSSIDNPFRDLLSACPSLFSRDKSSCTMSLSTYGTSCVSISSSYESTINILPKVEIKFSMLFHFIVGVMIIIASKEIAKSKYFHYFCGSSFFITLGVLLGVLYLITLMSKKNTSRFFVMMLTITGYGAGFFWFVLKRIKVIIFDYLELFLGYIALMATIGVYFTGRLRSEDNKTSFRFAVKCMIRFLGLLFLYNSTPSPMASLITVFSTILLFFVSPI